MSTETEIKLSSVTRGILSLTGGVKLTGPELKALFTSIDATTRANLLIRIEDAGRSLAKEGL